MKKIFKRVAVVLLAFTSISMVNNMNVNANDKGVIETRATIVEDGYIDTAQNFKWELDDEGTLIVYTGRGSVDSSDPNFKSWKVHNQDIKKIVFGRSNGVDPRLTVTGSFRQYFDNCTSLESIYFEDVDTTGITDMSSAFGANLKLTKIDFGENFDTSAVTNMGFMFAFTRMTEIDLGPKFDTSNVTSMRGMFANSWAKKIHFGELFDTSNVTSMNQMFLFSGHYEKLDLRHFDTSSLTDMKFLFAESTIKEIDMSSFQLQPGTITEGALRLSRGIERFKLGSGITKIDEFEIPMITPNERFTGRWKNIDTGIIFNDSNEFMNSYDGTNVQHLGTYEKEVNEFKVDFKVNDEIVSSENTSYYKDYKVNQPSDPELTHHTFEGWYADEACTVAFDFNSEITADTTVYGKFTSNYSYVVLDEFVEYQGNETLSVRVDAPYTEFTAVKVNGELVESKNYIVSEGSTIVTFDESYIKSLAN